MTRPLAMFSFTEEQVGPQLATPQCRVWPVLLLVPSPASGVCPIYSDIEFSEVYNARVT